MYFKFSILLLTFIIAANSVLGQNEDQVLEEAYEFALKHFNGISGKRITMDNLEEFLSYNNVPIVEEYMYQKKISFYCKKPIDLQLFKNIVREVCVTKGIDVTVFVNERKDIVLAEALPLEEAHNFALRYFNVSSRGSLSDGINVADMNEFLGYDKVPTVEEYLLQNKILFYSKKIIDFQLFKNILKMVCEKNGFDVVVFITERKDKAVAEALALEEAYNWALAHYHVLPGKGLSVSDMKKFVGSNNSSAGEYFMAERVSAVNQDNACVDFELFSGIVKAVCKNYDFDVRNFLKNRKGVIL